jgi:hypothetical protein
MIEKVALLAQGELHALILQGFGAQAYWKGRVVAGRCTSLLFDAVKGLDLVGSELTPAAARIIVEEDLVPVFLGS